MKFLLPIVVILFYFAGSQCNWLSPPAAHVEWGVPNEINMSQQLDIVTIYMFENTGNNWGPDDDDFFPLCEFRVENTTEEMGYTFLTGSYEFRQMDDGSFVWFARKSFDAEEDDYFFSALITLPDRAERWFAINIVDYNDEVPKWENGDWTDYSQHVLETEEWGEEGDMENESKRTIYEMTFSDRDLVTTEFTAEIYAECRMNMSASLCDEILSLVEVDIPYPIVGRAFVRRGKGKMIDREARDLFVGDSNELVFHVVIFDNDRTNNITSKFTMIVDDRNDNAPEFLTEDSLLIEVKEDDIVANKPLGQIKLRDLDDPNTPNGNFTLSIKAIKKEPSSPSDPELNTLFGVGVLTGRGQGNEFEIDIIPKTSFGGLAATYTLTLEAKDGENSEPKQLTSTKNYMIVVTN